MRRSLLLPACLACLCAAQTPTTGEVTGTITDQTGGVLAKVVSDVSDPSFGSIINLVSPPTSILGSFVGAASGRIIQLKAQLVF